MASLSKRDIALAFHELGVVKFGEFRLKSGVLSPIYLDLRLVISTPQLMVSVADALCKLLPVGSGDPAELICGVPYSALPIATCMAIRENLPMVMCRKEAKSYGTKQMVEGFWKPGQHCLVVEDVITSGSSLAAVVELLRNEGMSVSHALVLVNREQGGAEILRVKHKLAVSSLFTLTELVDLLASEGRISETERSSVLNFMHSTQADSRPASVQPIAFFPRLKASLEQLIQSKSTQLCVAIDTTDPSYLLKLTDKIGPKVCAIKLHLDILQFDSSPSSFISDMRSLSQKHGFLIIEDRKLADIGQTVLSQLKHGMFHISDWCDLVTVHCLPGTGLFDAFRQVNFELAEKGDSSRHLGALVVAQMSSKDTLADASYGSRCLEMCKSHTDVVAGFVTQTPLASPGITPGCMFYWVPGVRIDATTDQLGQNYTCPSKVLKRFPTDPSGSNHVIMIVGRGITEALEPVTAAEEYRKASISPQ